MAVTLDTIITAARDRHPAFDVRRTPSALLVRHLSAYQRVLQAKALQRNRRTLLSSVTVPVPLDTFPTITLPPNAYVSGGVVKMASDATQELPFYIIDASARFGRVPFPSGWLGGQQNTVLTVAGTPNDWTQFGAVVVELVPACVDLVKLSDTLVLPDESLSVFIERAALFMYNRGHKDSNVPPITRADTGLALQTAMQAEGDWLDSLGAQRAGQAFQIQDGY